MAGNSGFLMNIVYQLIPSRGRYSAHPPLIQHTSNFNFCPPFNNWKNTAPPGGWGYLADSGQMSNGHDVFCIDLSKFEVDTNNNLKSSNQVYAVIKTNAFDDIVGKYMFFAIDVKSEVTDISIETKMHALIPSGSEMVNIFPRYGPSNQWIRYYMIFQYPSPGDLKIMFYIYGGNERTFSKGKVCFRNPSLRYIGAQDVY
jgi:hypothetical protein